MLSNVQALSLEISKGSWIIYSPTEKSMKYNIVMQGPDKGIVESDILRCNGP